MIADPKTVASLLDAAPGLPARDDLFAASYGELRRLAHHMMSLQAKGHTLQATALVHEATLRLLGGKSFDNLVDTQHFFAAMAQAMRCVLVDHARRRKALRRGGELSRLELDTVLEDLEFLNRVDLLEVDEALDKLANYNEHHFQLVQLRFFLGMTVEEIAQQRNVSKSKVESDWRFARVWLARELKR